MGEIIYWKKYDEPKGYYDPLLKREVEKTGEWICEDNRVEKFWIYGSTSLYPNNTGMFVRSSIIFKEKNKDGTINRWESRSCNDDIESISQAEQYLKQLK